MTGGESSQTSSISSKSLPDGFRMDHNRRFDCSTKYLLPVDDEEIGRLDLQHFILRQLIHGNFNAPIEDALTEGIKVIDVGCGSGTWILEMAKDYPASDFVGIDAVADLFPLPSEVPPNCTFLQANTLEGLPFEDNTFDFVFQRLMILAFTPSDWEIAIQELKRVCKPGGWVELVEFSLTLERQPDTGLAKAMVAIALEKDIEPGIVWALGDLLGAHGFRDIEEDYISCPLGWGGRIGELNAQNGYMFYMAMLPKAAPLMGLSSEKYTELVAYHTRSYKEKRTWMKAPYAYGRKPLDAV